MWTCPKCQSRVDDAFEVCWSCGTTPDGLEDPTFVTADEAGPIVEPSPEIDDRDDGLDDFAGIPWPELAECFMADSVIEAKFVADRLIEQGIPAVADAHDINMMMGGLNPVLWGYGPKVRVLPKDLIRAQSWVSGYRERIKAKKGNAGGQ